MQNKGIWAVALFCSLLSACHKAPEEAEKAPLVKAEGEVLTLTEPDKATFLKLVSVEKNTGGHLTLSGRLVWDEERTVRVYPQVSGRVQSAAVNLGDRVKAGQLLATLSSADYGVAQSEAAKAAADWQVAKQNMTRQQQLREAGVIAEKDWELARAEATRAESEAARTHRQLVALGGDGKEGYPLRSPLSGVVVERHLNPGMEFRPDQAQPPLFVITDPGYLWLMLDAAEEDLRYLKVGAALAIQLKQYPGETFKGRIEHIADFVDPTTRTIKVRATLGNADRRLKGEMFASAAITLPPSDKLVLPVAAAMLLGDARFVLLDEGAGHYRRQRIETGTERDGQIEVLSGLKAGDKVVTEGNLHLMKYLPVPAAK